MRDEGDEDYAWLVWCCFHAILAIKHTFVGWRPILDVASDVNHSIMAAVRSWAQSVALANADRVVGCHGVHVNISHPHAADKASTRSHAESYGR